MNNWIFCILVVFCISFSSFAAEWLDNPSFESSSLGVVGDGGDEDTWASWNGNFKVVNTIAHTDSKSVEVGINTTSFSNFRQSDKPVGSPESIENSFWTFGCWFFYDSGQAGNSPGTDAMKLQFFATNNLNIHLTNSSVDITPALLVDGQWTYIERTVLVGAADLSAYTPGSSDYENRVTNRVNVQITQASPGQGGTFYVDDFVLQKAAFSFQTNPSKGEYVYPADPFRLSWSNPAGTSYVDVYFSTDSNAANWTAGDLVVDGQLVEQVDVSSSPETNYYWMVIAYDGSGNVLEQTEVLPLTVGPEKTPDKWSTPIIELDPVERLDDNSVTAGQPAVVIGEWDTAGNMQGWSDSGLTSVSVSNGVLSGTGTIDSPYIQYSGIFSEPDLDFGYFDYLQFRLKLPAGFDDDIVIFYGTTDTPGITAGSDLNIVIPAAEVAHDGNWHTYRLDLGLIVWWRDFLTDIRIYPLGGSGNGQTFEIDYLEVGDLPGDVLQVNTNVNTNSAQGETLADCSKIESKHAVFWYSPESYARCNSLDPQVHGRRALRMIEESLQVYVKKLKYDEPFESYDLWRRDGNRYKINHVTWYDGFWCGGYSGFMHIGINGWGLGDEGWGNPMPHEFGHYVQGHQLGFLTGGHWESHANFLRNSRNLHYKDVLGNLNGMMNDKMLTYSNFRQDHGLLIYSDFRIHHALADFGHELGLPDIVADLWKEVPKEETVYKKLEQALSPADDIGDVAANGLRHWPFLDFNDSDEFMSIFWGNSTTKSMFQYKMGSHLIPCQDKPGWYRSPFARSPEKYAFMSHELELTSSDITLELNGFDMLGTDEDWRWSLVATDGNWLHPRYGGIYSPSDGPQTFTMQAGETKLFLVVVPTPTDSSLNLEWTDHANPIDKHPDRLHYAYEVSMTGATPAIAQRQLRELPGTGNTHANGGGWVSNYATVDASAYVGPNAMVLDFAKVLGNARVEDYAVVMDNTTVRDNAIVSGHAVVNGTSNIQGNARVRDRALIKNAVVKDYAVAEGYTIVESGVTVQDHAIVRGCSWVQDSGGGIVGGYAIAGYDYLGSNGITDGVHFCNVPWGGWYHEFWWDTLTKPAGLVASYRVEADNGQICWDEFGAQHALLRGGVVRVEDPTANSKVLALNGAGQYVVLDRSVCDLVDGSISVSINPADNTDVPVIFMGGSASKNLQLKLNAAGKAEFTITDGSSSRTVTSVSNIPTDAWTSLTVTLDGSSCVMYVDGVLEAQGATSLVPANVLGSNDYSQGQGYYVGRNWAGDVFEGSVDDIRFYNIAMNQSQISNEYRRSGQCIGAFLFDGEMDFNGTSTILHSGVRNGRKRRLEADVYPRSSDDVSYYEAIFDSNNERNSQEGSGIGLDNSVFVVRLDNVNNFWNTGVAVKLNQWQHVALEFDGSEAYFYVDHQLRGTKTYSVTADDIAAKNYRIGFGMPSESTYTYFDGKIKNAAIYDRLPLPETDPPTPNPATWASVPSAINSMQITMTATTGTDASGVVEYCFEELTGNAGGDDSGWQSSSVYVDSGLQQGTEYVYTVKMRDDYEIETNTSTQGAARTYYLCDFNADGTVGPEDLLVVADNWLTEYNPAETGLTALWDMDETGGSMASDSIGDLDGAVSGAVFDGAGGLVFDGVDDYVTLPVGSVISGLTNCTFTTWVDFSNSGGDWQRIFDFGSGTGSYMFLCPRTGSSGPIKFALKKAGGSEMVAESSSTLPSGLHCIAVCISDTANTIKVYLDGVQVASKSGVYYKVSDLGVTTQNWLGRSQYSSDGRYKGSVSDFRIYDYAMSDAQVLAVYNNGNTGVGSLKADLDRSGRVDMIDLAKFSGQWMKSN